MKTCLTCGSIAFDDMTTCYVCMGTFDALPITATATPDDTVINQSLNQRTVHKVHEPKTLFIPMGTTNTQHITLHIRWANGTSELRELPSSGISIGRSTSCDLIVSDETVSREHARIYLAEGKPIIEDRKATNPTLVDGVPLVGSVQLDPGSIVRIATVEITVMIGVDPKMVKEI